MLNLSQVFLLLVSGPVCLAAAAQVKLPVSQPSLKVGEVAKYRTIDLWTNTEISKTERELVQVSDEKLVERATSSASPSPLELSYNRSWNPCRKLEYSNKEVCDGVLKFPLQIGAKHESREHPWFNGKGYSSMNCEVKGEERLTLKVGTVDTLRIECAGFWTGVIGTPRYRGRQSEIQWYAPAYGRTVQTQFTSLMSDGNRDQKTQTELVEFIPAK